MKFLVYVNSSDCSEWWGRRDYHGVLSHFEPSTSAIAYVYGFLPALLNFFIPIKVSKPIFRSLLEPLAAEFIFGSSAVVIPG
jgi:hypothetical protein